MEIEYVVNFSKQVTVMADHDCTDDEIFQLAYDTYELEDLEEVSVEKDSYDFRHALTYRQIVREFEEEILPSIIAQENGVMDVPMRREAFNNFTDSLHKDGQITDKQVDGWAIPDRLAS